MCMHMCMSHVHAHAHVTCTCACACACMSQTCACAGAGACACACACACVHAQHVHVHAHVTCVCTCTCAYACGKRHTASYRPPLAVAGSGCMAALGGVMSGDLVDEDSLQSEAVRASIDHTDEIGPVTITINNADHSEPLPTIIDDSNHTARVRSRLSSMAMVMMRRWRWNRGGTNQDAGQGSSHCVSLGGATQRRRWARIASPFGRRATKPNSAIQCTTMASNGELQ